MFITYETLEKLSGLGRSAVRVYMDGWRLNKYLLRGLDKHSRYFREFQINFNEDFITDFAEFMKLKFKDNTDFIIKARRYLKRKRHEKKVFNNS
ncbi:MAG: hypothetical protein SPL73_05610 [Cyanobacteriota bacterium]|nr:hypothetical protein [Cyanobacteriota bacterium]MDY6364348.1 hypothetical protein [Cyanobacteriota bacterium]